MKFFSRKSEVDVITSKMREGVVTIDNLGKPISFRSVPHIRKAAAHFGYFTFFEEMPDGKVDFLAMKKLSELN